MRSAAIAAAKPTWAPDQSLKFWHLLEGACGLAKDDQALSCGECEQLLLRLSSRTAGIAFDRNNFRTAPCEKINSARAAIASIGDWYFAFGFITRVFEVKLDAILESSGWGFGGCF
ncbi:MAG: hypothetical protein ACRD23_08965 [Terriglobales bacterium]